MGVAMYIFSRWGRVAAASPRQSIAAAIEVAGLVKSITDVDVSVFTTVASPDVGRISWSAMFESLAAMEAAFAKLNESQDYNDWADAHSHLFDGLPEDRMLQVIHGAVDPSQTVNVVSSVTGVCATGQLAAGLAAGVELAETAAKITGHGVLFGLAATGDYGRVAWLSGAESMADLDQAEAALNADPSWLPLVDRLSPAFQPNAETAWWQRLG
jgi:hypothetical protein